MVFLTGPRQVGKTTLARSFSEEWPRLFYLNFDAVEDRQVFLRREWDRSAPLVVFDEVHKWSQWKRHLKGVYDTEGIPPRILVTGSARLDIFRRGGDSLAGRYLLHRLLPLSVRELRDLVPPREAFNALLRFGTFPEPLLRGTEVWARRWRKGYLERIVREDLRDLSRITDIGGVELLVAALRTRVGSPISFASLGRDLQVSPATVKVWLQTLERLHLVFIVFPYHRNIARAINKEPKVYFYDPALALSDNPGPMLENLVAVSLLKALLYREDVHGEETRLCYLRDKEKREVDFVPVVGGGPTMLVEVKHADPTPGRGIAYYSQRLTDIPAVQVVGTLERPRTSGRVQVEPAAAWLAGLEA